MTVFTGEAQSLQPAAESQTGQRPPPFIYVLTVVSALGGFLFGYDTGVVSGAMLLIKAEFGLNHVWHELIVSITIAFAWLFALVGGFLSDAVGRKPTILGASFVFAVGAVVMGIARDKGTLLGGRAIVGAGIGLVSSAVPLYIAESSPAHVRGKLVAVHVAMVTGGQLLGSLVAAVFARFPANGWRYMLGLSGVPALLQFIGFLGMPESPRWLVSRGQTDRALEILRSIRGKGAPIEHELDTISEACRETEAERKETGNRSTTVSIFKSPTVRRALLIGCSLQLFQQLAGINTVMYYSAAIMKMAGVTDDTTAIWLAAATAGVNFVCTFIGLYLVERVGRRPLTLGSLLGVVVSLLLLALGFQLAASHSPLVSVVETSGNHCSQYTSCTSCTTDHGCGFCFVAAPGGEAVNGSCLDLNLDNQQVSLAGRCHADHTAPLNFSADWCPSSLTWLTIVGLVLYLFCFAPGMGPMPWTINSEIYPLWARSMAYSIASSCNWMSNLAVSMTFLTLTEVLTKQGTFFLYAGIAFVGLAFFYLVLPETKGCSLEEVEGLFAQPWFSRRSMPADKTIHTQIESDQVATSSQEPGTATALL